MSARLQETGEWSTKFVRGLPGAYKAFWFWLKSNCDHGGVWDIDIDLARLMTGFQEIEQSTAEALFESKILKVCSGDKWLLIDFCEEQFKTRELNSANTYHRGAIRILEKIDAFNLEIYFLKKQETKPLNSILEDAKEKEKIKEKEIDNVIELDNIEIKKEKISSKNFVTPFVEAFREFKEMRQRKRAPLTPRAADLIHMELKKIAGEDDELKILILQQSIKNSWSDVYPLKVKDIHSASVSKSETPKATRIPRKTA